MPSVTLAVPLGVTKDVTLAVVLDVTFDISLRDDVCNLGMEVSKDGLERNVVTLV